VWKIKKKKLDFLFLTSVESLVELVEKVDLKMLHEVRRKMTRKST
jgi:hypothetical protein